MTRTIQRSADGWFLHCHRDSPCCRRRLRQIPSLLSPSPWFKLVGSSAKILDIRSHLHAFIIEAVFFVEITWKPRLLARGRLFLIDPHCKKIVCDLVVTSQCTSQWRCLSHWRRLWLQIKTRPTLDADKTLGHPSSININMINDVAKKSALIS